MLFENIFYNITALEDQIKNKQIVIFGTGKAGKITGCILDRLHISNFYFVDNNKGKWQRKLLGKLIKDPANLLQTDRSKTVVLVASMFFEEIAEQLLDYGFHVNTNFFDVLTPGIKLVNFDVNNICNSHCVMCNVWQNKERAAVSIEQFETILNNPFFQRVECIGLIGGEPTLEKRLPQFAQAAINTLPSLQSIVTITNALSPDIVLPQLLSLQEICANANILFVIMLSLDGVGKIHDMNRGVRGNFNNFETVAQRLHENKIPFITGTTITTLNIWHLDELLNYLKTHNIYGRFRVAEFINRLHNNNLSVIRNFNEDEVYQLQLFFTKLETTYESDESIKNTYRSIKSVLAGGHRLIHCPYMKQNAVHIDCHGELSYCAPKSDKFGCLLEHDPGVLYMQNINILDHIKETYCANCIHDYQSTPTSELILSLNDQARWRDIFSIDYYNQHKKEKLAEVEKCQPDVEKRIFVIGWYGTETVGDKAILGAVVERYKKQYPQMKLAISSLYPFVTEKTLKELNIEAQVIPVFSDSFFAYASNSDEVVVGGGPLMDMEELSIVLWALAMAKNNNKTTTIYGCGIGPLYSALRINAVKEILSLSDIIYLRDEASVNIAKTLSSRLDICNIGDPAVSFLKNNYIIHYDSKKPELACFLRELTVEYRGTMNAQEFIVYKQKFEEALATNIINLCKQLGLTPAFYAMHNFSIGNDDRDFNYYLTDKYFRGIEYHVENKLSTIDSIVTAIQGSQYNLCMRFHSVVFASTMQTNFLAIDYTNGGKIQGFLEDHNNTKRLITMDDIIGDRNRLATMAEHLRQG